MPHAFAHIGEELRHRRVTRGASLSSMSETLRVPVTYLNAIEQLDADTLPATGYAVGYARSYGTELGMSGDVVIERFKADLSISNIAVHKGPRQHVKGRHMMLPKGILSGAAVTIFAASLVGWFGVHADDQAAPLSNLTVAADLDVRAEAQLPSDMYRLTATGPSWVEIRTRDNDVLLRRIFTPGERWEGAVQSGLSISVRNGHVLNLQRGDHTFGPLTVSGQRLDSISFDALEASLSEKTAQR